MDSERDPFDLPDAIADGPYIVSIPFNMGWALGTFLGLPFLAVTFPISLAYEDEGHCGEAFYRVFEGGVSKRTMVLLWPPAVLGWGVGLCCAAPFYVVTLPLRFIVTEPPPPPPPDDPPMDEGSRARGPLPGAKRDG